MRPLHPTFFSSLLKCYLRDVPNRIFCVAVNINVSFTHTIPMYKFNQIVSS